MGKKEQEDFVRVLAGRDLYQLYDDAGKAGNLYFEANWSLDKLRKKFEVKLDGKTICDMNSLLDLAEWYEDTSCHWQSLEGDFEQFARWSMMQFRNQLSRMELGQWSGLHDDNYVFFFTATEIEYFQHLLECLDEMISDRGVRLTLDLAQLRNQLNVETPGSESLNDYFC